ncbi:MAG: O-antigen ligase family protein [Chloroflexota bacterium]
MPRRVKFASLLAIGLHGILILTARYRLSYDAYNHMFFADHYRLDWWSLWEPRWYTGFEVVSYPPLVHQLIALPGYVIGVDAAFALVLWAVLAAYPLAVYRFARVFTGRSAAGYAAVGAALLPSLFLTAHVFGQLPTLAATLLALFGATVLADFLCHGGALTGLLAVFLFATVMAAHHATLLFVPWLVGAVAFQVIFGRGRTQQKTKFTIETQRTRRFFFVSTENFSIFSRKSLSELRDSVAVLFESSKEIVRVSLALPGTARQGKCGGGARVRVIPRPIFRLAIFTVSAAIAGWLVIFPFWQWGAAQTLQTPIDHLSRHNFIRDPFAAVLFFLPMYGLLIPFLPAALWMGRLRRFWGLGLAFLFLFLLGLGDTTPLPRLFFGPGWAWLTYDRFAFWASLVLLVFFGAAAAYYARRARVTFRQTSEVFFDDSGAQSHPGRLPKSVSKGRNRSPKSPDFGTNLGRSANVGRRWTPVSFATRLFVPAMAFVALLIGMIPTWLPTQPRQLDLHAVVDFLDQGDRSDWRYLTFGFGDQLARLSRLTEATTIDGSYHTARALPELRQSGVGQVDTAFWIPGGLSALDSILQKSGERGVRWGFVNLSYFGPVLLRNGWHPVGTLANGVVVWENPDASLPPPVEPPAEKPFAAFAWGAFPLFALSMSGALALRRYRPALAARLLPGIRAMAAGLLPLGLTFWYYRRLFAIPHERVYFTYSDALFFLGDGLALIIVATWLIQKLPTQHVTRIFNLKNKLIHPTPWLFALCALASLSPLWSLDWRTSLYVALHGWLAFGLYLSLRETPRAWRYFAIGSAAALFFQGIIGGWQALSQSTGFTMPLGLDWPGELLPAMSGASVVQLADGTRWLRAYGTLPHPNLLGGWTLVLLAALLTLVLLPSGWRIPALALFDAGLALLVLTFSRSAWLGLAVLGGTLLLRWKRLERKSLLQLAGTGLFCIGLLFIPMQQVFFTRLAGDGVQTEQVSGYTRAWLVRRTWEIIRQEPLLGVGAGAYPLALSQHVADFYDIEPVHNLPLLAWSELGVGGVVALAGLAVTVAVRSFGVRRPLAIIFSAALAGLFVISLFDHYLWTLAPGRLLFASALGLWAGQVDDERGG